MTDDASTTIRDANNLAIARDLGRARDVLVAAWRSRPLAEIADAVTEIERYVPVGAAKDQVARALDAWKELRGYKPAAWKRQLEGLVALPKDPRTAAILMIVASGGRTGSMRAPIWRALFARLGEIGDTRILPALRELEARARAPNHSHHVSLDVISAARARLEAHGYSASSNELAALASLGQVLERERAAAETARSLLEAVYAEPDDDAPREAFARFLVERGELRGELITLQLEATRRALTKAEDKRVQVLLAEHGRAWLGPLEPWLDDPVRYERGFPVACSTRSPGWTSFEEQVAWRTANEWSTIRECHGYMPGSIRRLRRITGATIADVAQQARKETLALEDLEVALQIVGHRGIVSNVAEMVAVLDEIELPSLRRLGLTGLIGNDRNSPDQFRPLFATRIAQQLTTFFTTTGNHSIAAWLADPPPVIPMLEIDSEHYNPGWRFQLSRDPEGRLTVLHACSPRRVRKTSPVDRLFDSLDKLPAGALTALTVAWDPIRPSSELVKRIDGLRARLIS